MKYLLLIPCLLLAMTTVAFAGDNARPAEGKGEAPKSEAKPAEEAPEFATIDKKAPDFTLKNANGAEVKLSSYAGKYVILEWINYDCPFVRKHYDGSNMQTLQKTYREKDVVWLQICSSSAGTQGHFEGEALKERIKKESNDAAFYLIDEDGKVGRTYKAKTTPHMYVIDKEGVLRYQGAIDSISSAKKDDIEKATNYVKAAMDELMAGKEVSTKETKAYGCSVKYAKARN